MEGGRKGGREKEIDREREREENGEGKSVEDKHRKQMRDSSQLNENSSCQGYRDVGEGECDSVAVPGHSLLHHPSSPHPLQAVCSLPPSHTAPQGETVALGNHQRVGTGGDDWLQNGGRICE